MRIGNAGILLADYTVFRRDSQHHCFLVGRAYGLCVKSGSDNGRSDWNRYSTSRRMSILWQDLHWIDLFPQPLGDLLHRAVRMTSLISPPYDTQMGRENMAKPCAVCRGKSKMRCDRCRNEFCQEHAARCSSCGTITCIRDLARKTECPVCKSPLSICPECLMNGKIVRLIPQVRQCPECGWVATVVLGSDKERKQAQQ